MEAEEKCDFHYECHRCKRAIPGHRENSVEDEIIAVKEKTGSSTYVFECFACNYNLW